ncbi:hypothetical protein PPYR_06796 [Photinus pyralis]|uniref:Uncharacterized protein n=1 Tax=Photinus pyralis TaxID=7054 RepID=A0A5N4ANN4_PHOPY|nr:hypothetical protein PPYR_06796 [Photinus pyralis]
MVPCLVSKAETQVVLPTAMVNLVCHDGSRIQGRALLDSASMCSVITSHMAEKLGLPRNLANIHIAGFAKRDVKITSVVRVEIESQCYSRERVATVCAIMPREITGPLPQAFVDIGSLNIPSGLELADAKFGVPREIDLLLGADIYFNVLIEGILKLGDGFPVLQNTLFGWVIGGSGPSRTSIWSNVMVSLFSQGPDLDLLIPQFWRLEEISGKRHMSPQDKTCEEIYFKTTKRLDSGKFEVRLPIRKDYRASSLGESLSMATQRFLSLEKRFQRDPHLKKEYTAFIEEYLELGHAKDITNDARLLEKRRYYFPHHCVIREDKSTTKYRVVFDGSMKTTSGLSLNDILLKGNPVQPDLFDIIVRFRTFKYVLTSDIQKMFRCVQVHPDDRVLQNIIWRDDPSAQMRHLELQTVTYGSSCSPFLATRTLVELANQGKESYPLAAQVLLQQTYVDDILGGANTLDELIKLQTELTSLLASAGFKLHKWNSNNGSLVSFQKEITSKVLGVLWDPVSDSFQVSVPELIKKDRFTKREVLGIIGQIFDPIGFVGVVTISAKVFMQRLWAQKLQWDDILPLQLLTEWLGFYRKLPRLKELCIKRWTLEPGKVTSIQLVGFSDASMVAYGACLYVRVLYDDNRISCNLVCSKSRVSPLKTVSLPRLELCGLLLLARMSDKFRSCMKFKWDKVVLYSDSNIVLAWTQSSPSRWTTFVANRVSEIQDLTLDAEIRHISSTLNPADYISRGLDPESLLECKTWFQGPEFLSDPDCFLKPEQITLEISSVPEQKQVSFIQTTTVDIEILSRFSSFTRMQRCIAYMMRFVTNTRKDSLKVYGALSTQEISRSRICIFRIVQMKYFSEEITCLKENKSLPKNSVLLSLNPFLDTNGLLRVGGRLENAPLSFDAKHPVILPCKDHVTDIMIEGEHLRLGHAGPRAVLNSLRQRVWPIRSLRRIKAIILRCVKCHRFRAVGSKQLMGSLPIERTQLVRAFLHTGLDFGGPIMVKESRLRKARVSKSYIALFVCMATKAIHIELVSSLSTNDFMLALKRFVSRRGNPISISSDNATNFKGANNALHEVYNKFFKEHACKIQDFASTSEIQWKFIPPSSPHWGGLWEAGIKSTKFHLKRVIGNSVLSFEVLCTVLTQIEAILNSRPRQPMADSISDLTCLTPGHFLIGQPLSSFPERDVSELPLNRLNIWQQCSKLRQDFWKMWSRDYLNLLQNRPKWKTSESNLLVGDLVLVREDHLPPLEWCLARILEVMPGRDNKVRVVKLKTVNGEFTRPVTKLSPLPLQLRSFVEDSSSKGGEC